MERRNVILVLLLLVVLLAFIGYNSFDARRAGVNGEVYSIDPQTGKAKAAPEVKTADNTATVSQSEQAPAGGSMTPPDGQTTRPAQETAGAFADTVPANPPNGMVFSGGGKYQLYRQGNITWRLNTDTGQTCIIFATDEEWRKPRVYKAGCGAK
jgi:outer membrane protein assembly factor BamB